VLHVVLPADAAATQRLTLHDRLGRLRLDREIDASREARPMLSLRGLLPGVYYLRVDGLPVKTVVVMK
jgi:hypothetical protein